MNNERVSTSQPATAGGVLLHAARKPLAILHDSSSRLNDDWDYVRKISILIISYITAKVDLFPITSTPPIHNQRCHTCGVTLRY